MPDTAHYEVKTIPTRTHNMSSSKA